MPTPTLSLRITRILLISFVLLQVGIVLITAIPHRRPGFDPYDLPSPARVAAMVETIDGVPPARRAIIADAFDGALYHVSVGDRLLPDDPFFASRAAPYRAALGGREVHMSGRHPIFPRLAAHNPWARWIASPIRLAIPLSGGSVLTIVSSPSEPLRDLLRQRALVWALGGVIALVALTLAVRATTRPIVRLARNIRDFAGKLDAPDLPVTGSSEMQDLAIAYNEMKARIAGLVAERTRILAAIAHDMRTYLTRLRLRAEFIDDSEQRALAAADLGEMAQLLDDTLLFARQRGEGRSPPQRIRLADELARTAHVRREMGENVVCRDIPADAAITAAPLAFRRILANLLDNAARHAERVTIEVREDGGSWRITVADDGPGVPAAMLDRLGQPFGRLEPSRDRATGGAGLGLAIVRALVEEQGGTVRFANHPAGGLVATLWFPRFPAGDAG